MGKMDGFHRDNNVLIKYESDDPIVEIPEGITDIAPDCFYMVGLHKVVFPKTLKAIHEYAFHCCGADGLSFHYAGTKSEWLRIEKHAYWNHKTLTDYRIHCIDGDLTEEVFIHEGCLFDYQGPGINVFVPKSVKRIDLITDDYYWDQITFEGTKKQWQAIKKKKDAFEFTMIHCADGDIVSE
ncbi:MAG: leucine-rich repeat domain-containing protein [Bacilli bacterium]|nr:leucine-rich repeat domain-containing protein [Bacilli bacterium]